MYSKDATPHWFPRYGIDAALVLVFLIASVAFYPRNTSLLNPQLYYGTIPNTLGQRDNWLFDADCSSVLQNMADRWSVQDMNRRHPLFSILGVPPTYALSIFEHGDRTAAAKLVFSIAACLWAPLLYLGLAKLHRDRVVAAAFTLAGMFCAGPVFWLSIPERHSFGSVSLALGLLLLALARDSEKWREVLVGSAFFVTLGMLITNSSLAILAGIKMLPLRKCVRAFYHAFAVMAIICTAASVYVPLSSFIGASPQDRSYTHMVTPSSAVRVAKNVFVHDYVAPRYTIVNSPALYPIPVVSFERSALFSTGTPGTVATLLWLGMLALAVAGILMAKGDPLTGFALPLYILAQFCLHVLYGKETFLYAANSVTVMIALCAGGARSRLRWPAIGLALAFAAAAYWNNTQQFEAIAAYTRALAR